MTKPRNNLFILSGGGMPGMDVLAGQLLALADAGIVPSAICGTSAGAGIGALLAAGYPADQVAQIIADLRDRDVRAERWLWKPRALWIDHFLEHDPIRKLLQRLLPADPTDLTIPYSCTTTRVTDGAEIRWSHPLLPGRPLTDLPGWREAVLASMSISGVFPWVCIPDAEGVQYYADGGVRAKLPLPANWRLFDVIYLLIGSYSNDYTGRGSSIMSRLLLHASWYAQDQIDDVIERCRRTADSGLTTPPVTILWPPRGHTGSLLRFDHKLIPSARARALNTLDNPPAAR